ncbi:MFS transporter [Anaerobacillus isosaccharinicus]|uniref:MFS transporter n=1 Tax=Anaerobacillus isosaccharinicus TaxID=1532552 RepID=A0A1S2LN89_9BACI|nr:MFS transporter [Anaerobacillus isosaccharinicus]MBA5586950.1 MFS transporter [Anaerobacillus isosaccharinicus]QOY34845.1 MFS transporter [Anaerobacillus isosaccharinicus]
MVYFLYIIIVIAFLDTFSQLPIIAPFAQSLGATSLLIGLIVGMYSLANMGGNIIAGQWIDKFGRKKILVIGLFFVSICLIGYAFVTTPQQLLLVRFLHGIGGGLLVPAAFAFLGDHSRTSTRGKTMAFSGACVGISAIIGPAFGAIITRTLGIDWVFYIISALFLVTAVFVMIILNENFSTKQTEKTKFDTEATLKLLRLPPLINAYIGAFSLMLTLGILAYMLPLKIAASGQSIAFSGILMSSFGIVAILFFVLPTNQIFDQVKREKMVIVGMLFVTGSLVILSLFELIFILFIAMFFYGIGFACIFPSVTALVIDHSNKHERGRAFGLFYAFFSLGVVVGSFIVGALNTPPNQGLFIGAFIMLCLALIVQWRIKVVGTSL